MAERSTLSSAVVPPPSSPSSTTHYFQTFFELSTESHKSCICFIDEIHTFNKLTSRVVLLVLPDKVDKDTNPAHGFGLENVEQTAKLSKLPGSKVMPT